MPQQKSRNITQNTIKQLYALSRNVCANPNCKHKNIPLVDEKGNNIGVIAHITAASPYGPRYDSSLTDDKRRDIKNLILLCADCNNIVDKDPETYTVDILSGWKKKHEQLSTSCYYQKFLTNLTNQLQNGFMRKQEITIAETDLFENEIVDSSGNKENYGKHVLSNFLLDKLETLEIENFPTILLRGVAGAGKTLEMKIAYNAIIDEFSNPLNYGEYQFCPIPYFFELKNYQENFFSPEDKNLCYLLFLDGLDELPDSKIVALKKTLANIQTQYPLARFIISGRDASFISEIISYRGSIVIKLQSHIDLSNLELMGLIDKYKQTPLEGLVVIPFYRNFISSQECKKNKSYKDFWELLITSRLKSDKTRFDNGHDISSRTSVNSPIQIESVLRDITAFCFNLFKFDRLVFTKSDIDNSIKEINEVLFILSSSIINYKTDEKISFISSIYYEFFVANYYASKNDLSLLKKDLFTTTGKIKTKYLNILSIMLNILDSNQSMYEKLIKVLNKENPAYILLTDYETLTNDKRYILYLKVIEEYNKSKKSIYYTRFSSSNDLLQNIGSLSDSLTSLLPKEYFTKAVEKHIKTIHSFLVNPQEDTLTEFSNAVILLGVGNRKIWNVEQQNLIKKESLPLLNFFVHNKLSDRLKGLLSEDTVLSWYETYNWANNWKEFDWKNFIVNTIEDNNDNFYVFKTEFEYQFKLKLFIHFYKNNVIKKLLVPLACYILVNPKYEGGACPVPNKLDDNFTTPCMHFNNDISYFTYIVKECDIDVTDLLIIIKKYYAKFINKENDSYQSKDLFKVIEEQFKEKINTLSKEDAKTLFEMFDLSFKSKTFYNYEELNQYIPNLKDECKIELFSLLSENLVLYKSFWITNTICLLLNIRNKEVSEKLLNRLNTEQIQDLYKDVIYKVYTDKAVNHVLFEKAQTEYSVVFQEKIKSDEKKQLKIDIFDEQVKLVKDKEYEIITNEDKLLDEVNNVFIFLETHDDFFEDKSIRGKFLNLELEHIRRSIQYDYENKYKQPPIFSPFVIKLLFQNTEDVDKLDKPKLIKNIKDRFSKEKYFWRYFFWLYVCNYKQEEIDDFIKLHPEVVDKIKDTMEKEVTEFIQTQDVSFFDNGRNRPWVVPFVFFLNKIYDNSLPEWFERIKILNFIAYPSWQLSTGYGFHVGGNFSWEEWSSVFDWIKQVSSFDENTIIAKALEMISKLKSDMSQAQIVSFFCDRVKYETNYKQEMLNVIFEKTCEEIRINYPNNETSIKNSILANFWNEQAENFFEKVIDSLDFENYSLEDYNYCRKSVIEYFCRVGTKEQKQSVIEKIKQKSINENTEVLLAKLGDEKSIINRINYYLKDGILDNHVYYHSSLFGNSSQSSELLSKYCELFKYSLEKSNDRRQSLSEYARSGIKRTVTKHNFRIFKHEMSKLLEQRKKKNKYFEFIQFFINEVEQIVFE